jgi:N-acetylglucosamine kinase-like BadF-type ATPase
MSTVFIGVDAGGTGTRALAATAAGEVLGRGRAAGANAWSSGTSPAEAIRAAVVEALGSHEPATVAGTVVAAAGAVSSVPEQAAAVAEALRGLGIAEAPRIVIDVVAAYASGTVAPRGLVLAVGTGSVAAFVDDGELVRRSGGRGWLVGDEGSAVWLGIEGVRAALLALDGRGPATVLAAAVPEALGVAAAEDVPTAITDAIYVRSPAELGRLAPLVVEAAEAGDAAASALIAAAAEHLVGTAVAAAGDDHPAAIVLAGSLLQRVPLLGDPVRERLSRRWPEATVEDTLSAEPGAVALAVRGATGEAVTASVLAALRS